MLTVLQQGKTQTQDDWLGANSASSSGRPSATVATSEAYSCHRLELLRLLEHSWTPAVVLLVCEAGDAAALDSEAGCFGLLSGHLCGCRSKLQG